MKALAGVCTCVAVATAVAGCGGDDKSSSKPATRTAPRTTAAKRAIDPTLKKDLGKATAGQLRRGRRYTHCLAYRVKRLKLKFRQGTAQTPPVIIGAIRGTRFGVNLGRNPAHANRIQRRLRAGGANALYKHGSTVIAFAGRRATGPDIAILTGCADRIG